MVNTDPSAGSNGRNSVVQTGVLGHPSRLRASRTVGVLDGRLRRLTRELCPSDGTTTISRAGKMLREIAEIIDSQAAPITIRDSESTLQHLTRLYDGRCTPREDEEFTATAAAYSAVVAALSRRFPVLDFDQAIGQLLELMIRLFKKENASWAHIYRHLRSIPDSVKAKQQLTRVCAADIHEWFDAGVQNLFSLRKEIHARMTALAKDAEAIAQEIRADEDELAAARRETAGGNGVVFLADRIKARQITILRQRRQAILDEKAGREETLALIQADIREFEDRLGEARRAYLVRPV